jgi:hypothetical protein
MRLAGRTDGNQTEVVAGLRARGYSVLVMSGLGKGAPDILVGRHGQNVLVELKDPARPLSGRKLTPDEKVWHANWRGQVLVATHIDEIIDAFL